MTDAPLTNHLGQPVGQPLHDWTTAARPKSLTLQGRFCRVESLNVAGHGAELYRAFNEDTSGALWTYLPYGPFDTEAAFRAWMGETCVAEDPYFVAIVDAVTKQAVGMASYLRLQPAIGSIEVGHINYAPRLQRTAAATEAMYLLMRHAFRDLGYRRYEWKCDALNAKSRAAAERLGFTYEGTFRQATVVKGRNRDTAWFSVLDGEWPALEARFEAWLAPENVGANGEQKRSLTAIA